ncbi:hypothetical protein ACFYTF_18725 [Nocardia thailandica]|uniref:Uncharacterized protein n=1 Tax=Nocardia thailandica TaxID=257275 RepID=A0ABW6PR27_9NOCA
MPEQQRLPQPEPTDRVAVPPAGPRVRRTDPGAGLRLLGLHVRAGAGRSRPRHAGHCRSALVTRGRRGPEGTTPGHDGASPDGLA